MYAGYPYAGGPWGGWSLALVADNETARPSANREGAISLTGMARVSVDPPLSPIPEELRGKEMLVGQQFEAPAIVGTRAVFSPQRASIPRPQDRIVIGGMDVTYWRGVATPLPDWQYVEPLGWGTCTIDLPQVVAAYEQPGQGELSFLAPGKPVRIERFGTSAVVREQVLSAGSGTWDWDAAGRPATVEVLVVAGGGGTASRRAGGGGAGEVRYEPALPVSSNVPWTVGAGGLGSGESPGSDGGTSSFGALVAVGGGGGGSGDFGPNGRPGGCGGGGARGGAAGVGSAGYNGGTSSYTYAGGGGGGMGAVGGNVSGVNGGAGGTGVYVAAFSAYGDPANPGWFGGGGAGTTDGTAAAGGKGGGGASYQAGKANTGGGGGGPAGASVGNRGGSGVIILRWAEQAVAKTVDYRGVVVAHELNGGTLSIEVGGHATGPAALRDVQPPLIQRRVDLGKRIAYGIRALHREHQPPIGATTGIQVLRKGGMNHLDYLNDIIGSAQTVDGKRWTTMPNEDGVYSTFVKDQTTKHFTVYHDDAVNRLEVRRDVSEEPNRAFVRLVTPGGMVVRYGAYPGLLDSRAAPYPFNDGRTFSQGTTDANTDSGDGITVMIWRLIVMGYISERAPIGTYDADITRAIRKLQKDVELPVTGTMNVKTWRRLFDLAATGYSTRRARILPAAQTPETKRWRRTASGSVVGKNKKYDPRILKVDRTVDFGATWTREQGDDFAESILSDGPQWVGSLTLESGAVIRGAHVPGVEITPEDLMPTRDIRPGMNVWIPHFAGGTLFHVSGVSVSNEGRTVTLVVDTKARDAMAAWSVIQRNRDNRNTPHRSFMQQHRKSMGAADNEFDEVGGKVERTRLEAGWNVIPVVAKQAGTINRTNIQLSANTEFAVAVFGRRTSRKRLRKLNPNPLTPAGTKLWRDPVVRKSLDEVYHVMYVAGGDEEPCGYSPAKKSDNKGLTGRWMDDASWPFYSFTGQNDAGSVLWLAIYVSVDCYLQGGRVFWPITEDY